MFDPRLVYAERQTHRQHLLDEAARDQFAAASTAHQPHDHPLLGNLLMSVGAALLTAGMRMNMRRLLATADAFDSGRTSYVPDVSDHDLVTVAKRRPPARHPARHKPRRPSRLADCA